MDIQLFNWMDKGRKTPENIRGNKRGLTNGVTRKERRQGEEERKEGRRERMDGWMDVCGKGQGRCTSGDLSVNGLSLFMCSIILRARHDHNKIAPCFFN